MLAGIGKPLRARGGQREVGQIDHPLDARHLGRLYLGSHHIAHEEQLGIAVVDDVVYLVRGKFVQNGHGHGPVGKGGQKGAGPCRTVAAAQGYLVAALYTAVLKEDM